MRFKLESHALDWLVVVASLVIFVTLEHALPPHHQLFFVDDRHFAYPFAEQERVPVWLLVALSYLLPACVLVVGSIGFDFSRPRSAHHHGGLYGNGHSHGNDYGYSSVAAKDSDDHDRDQVQVGRSARQNGSTDSGLGSGAHAPHGMHGAHNGSGSGSAASSSSSGRRRTPPKRSLVPSDLPTGARAYGVPQPTPALSRGSRLRRLLHASLLALSAATALTVFATSVLKNAVGRPRPDMLARCVPRPGTPTDRPVGIEVCTTYTAVRGVGLQDRNAAEHGAILNARVDQGSGHQARGVASGKDSGGSSSDHISTAGSGPDAQAKAKAKAKLDEGFRSFPSGHSSYAFSGLGFLSLWLAGQLGLFATPHANRAALASTNSTSAGSGSGNGNASSTGAGAGMAATTGVFIGHPRSPRLWRAFVSLAPLWLAVYIASSRVQDHRHHTSDVVVGAVLGLLGAALSYRLYFPPLDADAGVVWMSLDEVVDPGHHAGAADEGDDVV